MDTIEMKLCSDTHGDIEILLQNENKSVFFDIPSGKEVVYNDGQYHFSIPRTVNIPSKIFINEEEHDIVLCGNDPEYLEFKLQESDQPFFLSFGAVRIEAEINGQRYSSKSIAVMVRDEGVSNSVMNMIGFIYSHCEKYLYEECNHDFTLTKSRRKEIISLESKITFLQKALTIYRNSYQYLKRSPYCKLQQMQNVESFDKLQSVSQSTIRYISNHIDELVPVNYDTGIRYSNQYYQPKKVLVERNAYSYDVYENQVILGFLKTVTADIQQIIKELQERTYTRGKQTIRAGYIDSMYQIFSRSITKVNGYLETLISLKKEYQQLYYFYTKLFGIQVIPVGSLPVFTPVFRSVNAYRQIYQVIYEWFSVGNYDLGKDDLLLNFVSTTKIYEYYCLIKLLYSLEHRSGMRLTEFGHFTYGVNNGYYTDTGYNNTFVYESSEKKITLYFQPVVYGDDRAENGIQLYRNTSSNAKTENYRKGRTYTPDYILKVEQTDRTNYIILDAKFSSPASIRKHQLQELVYKYLFSLSPLKAEDAVTGLYIICGQTPGQDGADIVHDLADRMHRTVHPFAEILIMNGIDTNDSTAPSAILDNL